MPWIKAMDGTSLFYSEWGRGKPLLFLSSLGCSHDMWQYQFAALAQAGYRCIGFDRRGHGRSDRPSHGYDYDTLADDVAALVAHLDLRDLGLIAHSMAGGEVVRYVSRHGGARVERIVLLAPTTPRLLGDDGVAARAVRANFEALWAQWMRDYPRWVEESLAPFFVPETSRPMMRWAAGLLQASVPVAIACSRAMLEADLTQEMRSLEIPCLLIHGDRDRSVPVEVAGAPSAALLPDCRFLVYEGAPHGLMFTHMDRLHADMLQFLADE
ncbi:alpha/beta hydrolase [Thiomonas sp.]|uniref:alpha/beta fold hydrolase n=1 Tax=Thiomonas sp. TaxID=2047785 RepID=UPI00260F9C75|nr:alpha/beta hydrolase [Thiomonas sp.]